MTPKSHDKSYLHSLWFVSLSIFRSISWSFLPICSCSPINIHLPDHRSAPTSFHCRRNAADAPCQVAGSLNSENQTFLLLRHVWKQKKTTFWTLVHEYRHKPLKKINVICKSQPPNPKYRTNSKLPTLVFLFTKQPETKSGCSKSQHVCT